MAQASTRKDKLFELANLFHSIARQLPAPDDLQPGPCTPLEIEVMRFVRANPGASASAAAAATGLPASNFSRVLKRLVEKGQLRREPHEHDARLTRLYATDLARQNWRRMRDAWSASLDGSMPNIGSIDALHEVLTRIDRHLAAEER